MQEEQKDRFLENTKVELEALDALFDSPIMNIEFIFRKLYEWDVLLEALGEKRVGLNTITPAIIGSKLQEEVIKYTGKVLEEEAKHASGDEKLILWKFELKKAEKAIKLEPEVLSVFEDQVKTVRYQMVESFTNRILELEHKLIPLEKLRNESKQAIKVEKKTQKDSDSELSARQIMMLVRYFLGKANIQASGASVGKLFAKISHLDETNLKKFYNNPLDHRGSINAEQDKIRVLKELNYLGLSLKTAELEDYLQDIK